MSSRWGPLVHAMLHRVGFDLVRWKDHSDRFPCYPPDFDETDRDTISKVLPYTMTSPERLVALIDAVEYTSAPRTYPAASWSAVSGKAAA